MPESVHDGPTGLTRPFQPDCVLSRIIDVRECHKDDDGAQEGTDERHHLLPIDCESGHFAV
jgi:hypothetical protein